MHKRVLIIQGHPDMAREHLCHALAAAYADGARAAGHDVECIDIAQLDFPLVRSQADWEHGALPPSLEPARRAIGAAEHLVLIFPLWLGDMPALLKAFLEQVLRPAGAAPTGEALASVRTLLAGKSARLVVTMGMPAVIYRWYFRAHSVRSLERNVLAFVGVAPVRRSLIGMAGNLSPVRAGRWLGRMARLGSAAR